MMPSRHFAYMQQKIVGSNPARVNTAMLLYTIVCAVVEQ
jgi:hypothetical protein